MEKFIVSPSLRNKLENLITILFDKEYFGFKEQSKEYVNKIFEFLKNIPDLKHRKTKNKKHGQYYVIYRVNKKTCYYITFDKKEDRYFVRNIFTNHTKEYIQFILKSKS